jgi:hypothetical protein
MAMRKSVAQFILAFAVAGLLVAHAATDSIADRLTGCSSREWVYKRVVRMMGSTDACSSGKTYEFSSDHMVAITEFTSGHLTVAHHKWTTATNGDKDIVLSIEGMPALILLFRDDGDSHFIRLRTPSGSRTVAVIDEELELVGDD